MQAVVLEQHNGQTHAALQSVDPARLPPGNVTVDIDWSGLNYKDALAITGRGKIVRAFPMVPGIDFAGRVHHSEDPRFHVGQAVILTGWGVGEMHWGGMAEQARVTGDWLVPLPEGLDARRAMIIGTAGLTAMLCVMALQEGGVTPEAGPVLVSGASGGVGSTAVALLHALGYAVTAVSGRPQTYDYLRQLGASEILSRAELSAPGRPLEKQRWAGAVDTVGGQLLANVLAQSRYGGVVATCGLAGGADLPGSVMPFILRNVRLQGIDSVRAPAARRLSAWRQIIKILPHSFYKNVSSEIPLSDVILAASQLLANEIQGRTLVKVR
ncbi:MDR family oxidoreductase [Pantoea sp. 1.19]|uniref:acrylyl-CoA reductase (NADPH) n=1 Tax=Pantoea sp. 1.19 TaxID=1925589 RepID=UPI000948E896|nr:MDR family oxidoreductase [Pantoea sp. 1.19]